MATGRTSVRMQTQIKEMYEQGHKIRAIARVLKVGRPTIRKAIGIGGQEAQGQEVEWKSHVDWERVREELSRKGATIQVLHQELCPSDVSYTTFWRALRKAFPSMPEATIRLEHKIGEKTQMDFCNGIDIVDRYTGARTKTHLFCGVLCFSSYTYGEFVLNQKLTTFLGVQERMWSYFGGVTPYAVIDNLKAGVSRADIYDPDVNPTYCEFGNHYGFAVLPARPRRPRDKGKNESHIGVIQRQFFARVRNRTFYSLADLNEAFRAYLDELNASTMKDWGVSRHDRYTEEKKHLKSLPDRRFEITEWRRAKVHPDCHIQVEKNFYSVPYRHVGQEVSVRLREFMVEVFTPDGEPITAHMRLKGRSRTSTQQEHYPEAKLASCRFDIHRAKEQARRVGPKTKELVETLFNHAHPLKHLRRVQGILRLTKQVDTQALEHATGQALTVGKSQVAYIKACALHYQVHGNRPTLVAPVRKIEHIHVGGEKQ